MTPPRPARSPAAPPPVPRRRRVWPWLLGLLLGLAVALGVGLTAGLILVKRLETGRWQLPSVEDVKEVIEVVVPPPPPPVAKVIVLEKGPVTLQPGVDDAARGVSSVVLAHHPDGPVTMPGWKGSKANWTKLVGCVRTKFAPFAVEITEQRPAHDDYVLVVVGGRPRDLGATGSVTGLAPFNGAVIPRAVVFAFAAQMKHAVTPTCETIAMEIAHAYGLDHAYLCKDLMTYLGGCGAKSFVDKDAPCGERKKRACHGGAPTQNSFRRLISVLGAAPAQR